MNDRWEELQQRVLGNGGTKSATGSRAAGEAAAPSRESWRAQRPRDLPADFLDFAAAVERPVAPVPAPSGMDDWLTAPAGMKDTAWRKRPAAFADVGNPTGLVTTPRDTDRFGQIMNHVPMMLAWGVLPGPTIWQWARKGTLAEGDAAPDFTLARHDQEGEVTLSSYRGQKPVVLVFGSYT